MTHSGHELSGAWRVLLIIHGGCNERSHHVDLKVEESETSVNPALFYTIFHIFALQKRESC
jgi:hypothetical protein